MILDRSITPTRNPIEITSFLPVEEGKLDNGVPVFTIDGSSQEILKVEFVFNGGRKFQKSALVASAASHLLNEGTLKRTAAQIASEIDYYGAFISTGIDEDQAFVTVYVLNKYLKEVMVIIQDVLLKANFPEKEFDTYLRNSRSQYQVNSQKVDVLCRRQFSPLLFGEKHDYANFLQESDYDLISLEGVKEFYNEYYNLGDCEIHIAGKITSDIIPLMNSLFGSEKLKSKAQFTPQLASSSTGLHVIEKSDAMQSAIRMGKLLFTRTHEDYSSLQVVNTLFGGYFGSRLMMNIREDKGYTYGIGSHIVSLFDEGYLLLSTEVGTEVTTNTLNEIEFEMKRLQQDLVSDEELERVKNYMIGSIIKEVDGPFEVAHMFKVLRPFGYELDYIKTHIEKIHQVTKEDVLNLSQKYLKGEDFVTVVAGKK